MSAWIAGAGAVPCRRWYGERTAGELSLGAIRSALADAGLTPRDVDGLYTTQIGWFALQEKFLSQRMAETLAIETRAQMEVECGGASSPYGVVAVIVLYAMSAQAYAAEHGLTPEDLAGVAVTLRRHAQPNPLAFLRTPITLGDVLASRVVSPPLRFLECAPWADGAAAVVLVGDDRAGERAVRVAGIGEAHDATSFAPLTGDVSRFPNAARAAADAYARAGVGPGELDVAEVYGAFGATELQLYEELGLAGPGEAPRAVAAGRTTYGGDLVVNPSGGRLSLGHPPYATPLYETVEIVSQLRGEAGERQVPSARLGLVHAEHGMVNGSGVAILEKR